MYFKKLFSLLVLLLFTVGLAAQTEKKITASFKNIPLSEAMKQIEQQTGNTFFYDATQVDVKQKVSLNSKNESLSSALNKLLTPLKLQFEVSNKQIVVFTKKSAAKGPAVKVKGTVVDDFGDSVIGANVMVEGTTVGVITDIDGNFELEVPRNANVVVSYIGYQTQTIKFTNQPFLNIKLKEDSQALAEVVVVGYGTQKKVNLTGSVAQVDSKQLENRPIQNLSTGLQGLMPGVTITSNGGRPGQDGGTIRVRGVGTLNDSNPYILVDGVETGTMNSVDPNDIESISVLKDAASAAIYGSKASNGVILITTKRGKTGKPRISYNGYVSAQNATMLPDLLSSYDYARLLRQAQIEAGVDPRFTEEEIQKFKDGSDPQNYPNTDWLDLGYQTGVQHSHNVSMTGGTDNMKYMASAGYLHQTGILPHSERQQFNGRTNLDLTVNKRMNVRLNMAYINNDYSDPNASYAGGSSGQIISMLNKMAPWITARYEDGTWGTVADGSPIAWLDVDQTVRRENQNFSGTLSGDYKIIDGLVATITGSYVSNSQHYKAFQKFIQYNPNKASEPNKLNENYYNWHRGTFDALLNYDKQLGKHGLKAMAGWHTEKYKYYETTTERKNFPNNDLTDMNAGDASTQKNSGYSRELAMISWFGRVNYDYAGKYLFEANIRADASSRFAKGNRWGYFPSFSAAWRITEESFMESAKSWLSSLKLRASYGNLGNQSALSDYYPWMNTYSLSTKYPFGGNLQSGYYQSNYKIATISWEKARTWGVGFDATLLDKWNISFDYYDRKTTGIIMDVPVPREFGLGAYKDNVGAMLNRGIELTLGYNNKWGDWSFGASANLAYNKNKILDLNSADILWDGDLKVKQVGEAINSYRMYHCDGIFQSDEEAAAWQAQHKNDPSFPFKKQFKAGDLRYADMNGDGYINPDDRTLCGSSDPKFTFALNLNTGWKQFDLSMMFTGVADVKRYIDYNGFGGEFSGDNNHPSTIWLDAWTPENKDASMPRITYNSRSNNLSISDFWLQDASYIRLKNLQFGYTVPEKVLKPLGIEKVRIYYSGENLLTFHNMMVDIDPESGWSTSFPLCKTHAFGVNITF